MSGKYSGTGVFCSERKRFGEKKRWSAFMTNKIQIFRYSEKKNSLHCRNISAILIIAYDPLLPERPRRVKMEVYK